MLASQRAEAVRQYLLGKGVDAGRLSTLSMGEFKPLASNSTQDGRALNRTAQFRIFNQPAPQPEAIPAPVAAEPVTAAPPAEAPAVTEMPAEVEAAAPVQ